MTIVLTKDDTKIILEFFKHFNIKFQLNYKVYDYTNLTTANLRSSYLIRFN